jgi:hypothetical protein
MAGYASLTRPTETLTKGVVPGPERSAGARNPGTPSHAGSLDVVPTALGFVFLDSGLAALPRPGMTHNYRVGTGGSLR